MKIDKVMNNNVVSSIDEDGQEIIVVGTGIGFQGKEGKVVDEKKIQKIFRLEDPKMIRKLKEILQDLPMEQFEISTAIIEHAKQSLGTELNENIYVTLTDHIHFAIQRYEDHMNFPNPMLREVRLFYEKEFALGEYALGMIKQRLNISLPLDDAASIALHIVSAEFDTRVKDTLKITEFLEDVMEQIKNYFHLEIDTQSLSYERFITQAMIQTAKSNKKKIAIGLVGSAALCAFVCGVTEPFEFGFMFLAPGLYVIYAILYGIFTTITTLVGFRAGFSFSAGATDLVFSSSLPAAQKTWMIIPLGIAAFIVFYVVFRIAITKFDLKTPGREDDDLDEENITLANDDFTAMAAVILEGLGGSANVKSIDNCITRLRLEINDDNKIDEAKIKSSGAAGIIRPGKGNIQVIIGPKVQFVADEMEKLCK